MTVETIREGISRIQEGKTTEGGRLLKMGLKDPNVPDEARAIAYLWLANTEQTPDERANCYRMAYQLAPHHPEVRKAWENFQSASQPSLPVPPASPTSATPPAPPGIPMDTGQGGGIPNTRIPTPTNVQPGMGTLHIPDSDRIHRPDTGPPSPNVVPPGAAPLKPQDMDRAHRLGTGPLPRVGSGDAAPVMQPDANAADRQIVGIINTSTRPGTGFFISKTGLIATTRHLVGSLQQVTVEIQPGQQVQGRVLRSYPSMDLALVQVEYEVADLWSHTSMRDIPNDAFLRVLSYRGEVVTGKQRPTQRQMARHWFTTTITRLPDAGGDPIFDEHNFLVGMLTRNTSRTSNYVHGVLIAAIREAVDHFTRDYQFDSNRAYCPNCGYNSRAADDGFFYCELCGAVLPHSWNKQRIALPQSRFNYETEIACPHCEAFVGFHNGHCLRCGREYNAPSKR